MRLARLHLCIALLLLSACAQTETQRHGYQTADLLLRCDPILYGPIPNPDPRAGERAEIRYLRNAYNLAVRDGDAAAMRRALDDLNAALTRWGTP